MRFFSSIVLVALGLALFGAPVWAKQWDVYSNAPEGEDLESVIPQVEAGDTVLLHGNLNNAYEGEGEGEGTGETHVGGVAVFEVNNTLTITKNNVRIVGETGFSPAQIEIRGVDNTTAASCLSEGESLQNGYLDNEGYAEGEGEPAPVGPVVWDWFPPSPDVIIDVHEGESVEYKNDQECPPYAAQSERHIARFKSTRKPDHLTTSIEQTVTTQTDGTPSYLVSELRYLLPIIPAGTAPNAYLNFKLKIVGGTADDKLEVLADRGVTNRVASAPQVVKTITGDSAVYNTGAWVQVPAAADPSDCVDVLSREGEGACSLTPEGEGEATAPPTPEPWTYLTFRATIASTSTVRFMIDSVSVGGTEVIGGGFEDDQYQVLWQQTSVGTPIITQDTANAYEGEWLGNFAADASSAARRFLRFFYRVDKAGSPEGELDYLNVYLGNEGEPITQVAATGDAIWHSVNIDITEGEAYRAIEGEMMLRFENPDNRCEGESPAPDYSGFTCEGEGAPEGEGAAEGEVVCAHQEGTFSIDDVYLGPPSATYPLAEGEHLDLTSVVSGPSVTIEGEGTLNAFDLGTYLRGAGYASGVSAATLLGTTPPADAGIAGGWVDSAANASMDIYYFGDSNCTGVPNYIIALSGTNIVSLSTFERFTGTVASLQAEATILGMYYTAGVYTPAAGETRTLTFDAQHVVLLQEPCPSPLPGPGGGPTTATAHNWVQNPEFETWPQTAWTPDESIQYSPLTREGYNSSHGFARLGLPASGSRDVVLLEQKDVTIPDEARYLEFYLQVRHPSLDLNQFEVWITTSDGSHLLYLMEDSESGFDTWRRVRLDILNYRGLTGTIRFVARIYPSALGEPGTKFLLDTVCLRRQAPLGDPVIDIDIADAGEGEGETVGDMTLWNLSVTNGTPDIRVTKGGLTARRCGIFDAASHGVQIAGGSTAILANTSISYNAQNGVRADDAKRLAMVQCTLVENGGAAVYNASTGATLDVYASLLDRNAATFESALGADTIVTHYNWVPGCPTPDYGDAVEGEFLDDWVEGEGECGTAEGEADRDARLLSKTPPYCEGGCNEIPWPGNLRERIERKEWPPSKMKYTDLPADIPAVYIAYDFERDARSQDGLVVGADEPSRVYTGGAGRQNLCDVFPEIVGAGGQVSIWISGGSSASADVQTRAFIVPQMVYQSGTFDPLRIDTNTCIALDAPTFVDPDGNAEFLFNVPYPADPTKGVWFNGNTTCLEGRAMIYVQYPGQALSSLGLNPAVPGCSFIIDTIPPQLAQGISGDPVYSNVPGGTLITTHNDTCLPAALGTFPPAWSPGTEYMPFSAQTWATGTPQVFFNIPSLSDPSLYSDVNAPEGELQFTVQLGFADPHPPLDPANPSAGILNVEVAGFAECSNPAACSTTELGRTGMPVWREGLPNTVTLGLTLNNYDYVTASWFAQQPAPLTESGWYPRQARFSATDLAGNASDLTPPLELWWMRKAEIVVSGPGDPENPVFTWSFIRPADPKNPAPSAPIFRYIVVPVLTDAGGNLIVTPPLLNDPDWSDWLDSTAVPRITGNTPCNGAYATFEAAVNQVMTTNPNAAYLKIFVQAGDEAGNISPPAGNAISSTTMTDWPVPTGAGMRISTRISARFWYRDRSATPQEIKDWGSAVRIPVPTDTALVPHYVSGDFTITMGAPDTAPPPSAQWELYRDGVLIDSGLAVVGASVVTRPVPAAAVADPLAAGLFAYLDTSLNGAAQVLDGGALTPVVRDGNYLFKAFTFIDVDASGAWDAAEPRDREGASFRFTVLSGKPIMDTQPIKSVVKGE